VSLEVEVGLDGGVGCCEVSRGGARSGGGMGGARGAYELYVFAMVCHFEGSRCSFGV